MGKLKIVGIVLAILIGGYWILYPNYTWNYRMTLEVQTPNGVKSGSAVRELFIKTYIKTIAYGQTSKLKGEAAVVDLGEKGLLFGLLRSQSSVDAGKRVLLHSFKEQAKKQSGATEANLAQYNRLKTGTTAQIEPRYLPMLVRFRDIKDPKSVELVDPANLAATYGAGYALKSATIEITDDPVTTGIEKVLPWLELRRKGYLDGQFAGGGPELSNILHSGDFQKGNKK